MAPSSSVRSRSNVAEDAAVAEAEKPAPACPACGTDGAPSFDRRRGYDLRRCRDCSLVFIDPLPEPATIAALYTNAYDDASSGYFSKPERKLARSRGRIRHLARHVAGGRFLDVGCNGGFMVEAAREAGFEATGLDLDPVSLDYARRRFPGSTFMHSTVEALQAEAEPFDAVYCSEVIEHVPAVDRFVAALAGLMRPGAVLYLTTPDFGHWRRPRDLDRWDAFCPPDHCLYFDRESLGRLLERHGLGVFRRRPALKPGIKLLARKVSSPAAAGE